jgi:Domain of unknown function (DUF1707)
MNMTEARRPAAQLRASDADRDAVVAALSEHYQAGRLSTDELEERTGAALSARTHGELTALTEDLPGPAPAGQRPATPPAGPPVLFGGHRGAAAVLAVLTAVLIAGAASGLLVHHGAGAWGVVPVVLIIARIARIAGHGDRHQRRSGRF